MLCFVREFESREICEFPQGQWLSSLCHRVRVGESDLAVRPAGRYDRPTRDASAEDGLNALAVQSNGQGGRRGRGRRRSINRIPRVHDMSQIQSLTI